MYCSICKNAQHVTAACRTKKATTTTVVTAGSAPKINNTQEETSGSEELWTVSQRMTGSAFATAAVSTAASGRYMSITANKTIN